MRWQGHLFCYRICFPNNSDWNAAYTHIPHAMHIDAHLGNAREKNLPRDRSSIVEGPWSVAFCGSEIGTRPVEGRDVAGSAMVMITVNNLFGMVCLYKVCITE